MSKNFGKKAVTVVLSAALLGGVFVSVPNAVTTTVAHADDQKVVISYDQFLNDVEALKSAVNQATPQVQAALNSSYFNKLTKNPKSAYGENSPSFVAAIKTIANDAEKNLNQDDKTTAAADQDIAALTVLYNQFNARVSADHQDDLGNNYQDLLSSQRDNESIDWELSDFSGSFEWVFDDLVPNDITGIPSTNNGVTKSSSGQNPTPVSKTQNVTKHVSKSKITMLSAKKSSKKYVKVTGKATLHKKANYARIHTYKGYRYAKLSSKHTFSKKIYAPKAKSVKAAVGYYSHGHFSAVTSSKTVHVK